MDFVVVWGWVCALVGAVMSLPQIVRLLRSETSAGVSLLLWQLMLGSAIGWTAHGLASGHVNLVVPNAINTVLSAAVLAMVARDRGLGGARVWPLGLGVGTALVASEQLGSAALFGAVVIAPIVIGLAGQTRDLVREPDIRGLSGLYVVGAFVLQVLWWSWSLMSGDISTFICSTAVGLVTAVNAVLWTLRVRGLLVPRTPGDAVVPQPAAATDALAA